jgi:RNA polymerase sigma-70 factor (ECF subfamily)
MKEESLLLVELREGSEKDFDALYKLYRERLYGTVYNLIKSHEFAEEILQDVFIKIWLNRSSIDLSKSFSAYLDTIAKNTVYDYFRKIASDNAKIEQLILIMKKCEPANAESLIALKEVQSHLDDILFKLPQKCREVYVLCRIEGRSHEEVSKLLNISKSTINNHIMKASRIVKANWKPEYLLFLLFFIFK